MTLLTVLGYLSTLTAIATAVTCGALLAKKGQVVDIAHMASGGLALVTLVGYFYLNPVGVHNPFFLAGLGVSGIFVCYNIVTAADRVQRRRKRQIIRRRLWLDGSLFVLYLVLLGYCVFSLRITPAPAGRVSVAGLPVWRPQAALVSQLGPEVRIEGYGVRPPRGLVFVQRHRQSSNASATFYQWEGARRANGTRTIFSVEIAHPAPNFYPEADLMTLLTQVTTATGRAHRNYTASGMGLGNLRGVAFSRLYWKGVWPRTNTVSHGLTYATSDPQAVVTVRAGDTEPYCAATLPVCEAAALTLHKF